LLAQRTIYLLAGEGEKSKTMLTYLGNTNQVGLPSLNRSPQHYSGLGSNMRTGTAVPDYVRLVNSQDEKGKVVVNSGSYNATP